MAEAPSDQKVPRRPLGKTGLEVSILGFGASPLGSVFEDIDEDEGVRSVHEAFARGINYFDVSPFYGLTKAEAVLGRALKDLPRDQLVLSTKVGRYGQGEFDFSGKRVTESIDESCNRLNVEYIDIIICHDIEFVPLQQIIDETLPALQELKKKGKVKFVGISGLPLKIFRWVLEHAAPGSVDVILSYCHYNLTDNSLLTLLPLLNDKGVGVINASPLAMGLLTPQGPPSWHPASAELKEACIKIVKYAEERGLDLPGLALRFSTKNPDVSSTLVGMCSTKQVLSNIGAILEAPSPSEDAYLEGIEAILGEYKNSTWPSGLQENN